VTVTTDLENVATATGTSPKGDTVEDSDTAFVSAPPAIRITKTADPTHVPETGGSVTFTFLVENIGQEDVTLTSLSDTQFGSLDGKGTCNVPQTIVIAGSYSCTYTVTLTSDALTAHYNVATATAVDNEGTEVSDEDDETVTFDDVEPTVVIVKSADPVTLPEPGGSFTYTLTITNTSAEAVTVEVLSDNTYALPEQCTGLIGTSLGAGASISCSFTATHANAGSYTNTASVTVSDNDGNSASDTDDETVTVTNAAPVINVIKSGNPTIVPLPGDVTFTVVVENQSVATDPVLITSLTDDIYGNLDGKGTCDVPQTIQPGGNYTCSFTVSKGIDDIGTETDTVTASGTDDEGTPASDSDDATVSFLPPIVVTNSSLCVFDYNPDTENREFRLLFSQDPQTMPYYKLTSSNPGQFYFNGVIQGGPGQTVTFPVAVPYAFATQGARPVHVYDQVNIVMVDGQKCFVPGTALATVSATEASIDLGDYTTGYTNGVPESITHSITLTLPDGILPGFYYINFHLDYDLKGPNQDGPDVNTDPDRYGKDSDDDALVPGTTTGEVLIPEMAGHTFCIDPDGGGAGFGPICDTAYNDNEFKKNPGVAGIVVSGVSGPPGCSDVSCGTPIVGARVELVNSSGVVVGTALTNEDGWYQIVYKHTGKPALYTVNLYNPASASLPMATKSVTLKGNAFVEVSFPLP
jgi:hypothetical protein